MSTAEVAQLTNISAARIGADALNGRMDPPPRPPPPERFGVLQSFSNGARSSRRNSVTGRCATRVWLGGSWFLIILRPGSAARCRRRAGQAGCAISRERSGSWLAASEKCTCQRRHIIRDALAAVQPCSSRADRSRFVGRKVEVPFQHAERCLRLRTSQTRGAGPRSQHRADFRSKAAIAGSIRFATLTGQKLVKTR